MVETFYIRTNIEVPFSLVRAVGIGAISGVLAGTIDEILGKHNLPTAILCPTGINMLFELNKGEKIPSAIGKSGITGVVAAGSYFIGRTATHALKHAPQIYDCVKQYL